MNNKRVLLVCFFVASLCLGGCTTFGPWTEMKESSYTDNSRGFKSTIPVGWMRYNGGQDFAITRDGFLLNKITVRRNKTEEDLVVTKKKFSQGMSAQELAEVEIDILKSIPKITDVIIKQNKPTKIDGESSFLIEYSYRNDDGLKYDGQIVGFLHGKWVYRLCYESPSIVYYGRYISDWEKFLSQFSLNVEK